MTSFWVYIIVEIPVPLFIVLLVSIGVGLAGCHALEPNKLVRIMFPFLKKKPSGHTYMFSQFELSSADKKLCYFMMLQVVFQTTFIFLSAFVKTSYTYNPYDDIDCYFFSNLSKVEVSPQEALKLEEHIQCFTWQFNIGGAVGQATGTLAFTWLVSSVMIWIFVHLNHNYNSHEGKSKKGYKSHELESKKSYLFLGVVIRITITAFTVILMIITVIVTHKGWISFLSAIEIGAFSFLVVSFAVIPIVPVKKNEQNEYEMIRSNSQENHMSTNETVQ